MPLPHERAAIEAASGARRAELEQAAAVLDRVRTEHGPDGTVDALPADLQPAVRKALQAFRPSRALIGLPELLLLALLAAGGAVSWLMPVQLIGCRRTSTAGQVECVVSDQVFGIVPYRWRTFGGVAGTQSDAGRVTEQSTDSKGHTSTSLVRVAGLALLDGHGDELWRTVVRRPIGLELTELGRQIDELLEGARRLPVLGLSASWVTLLVQTVFMLLGVSSLASAVGLALRDRGWIPHGVYRVVFYWGAFAVPAVGLGLAWVLALIGGQLPDALLGALGLG